MRDSRSDLLGSGGQAQPGVQRENHEVAVMRRPARAQAAKWSAGAAGHLPRPGGFGQPALRGGVGEARLDQGQVLALKRP
jgi:hypothetical protein